MPISSLQSQFKTKREGWPDISSSQVWRLRLLQHWPPSLESNAWITAFEVQGYRVLNCSCARVMAIGDFKIQCICQGSYNSLTTETWTDARPPRLGRAELALIRPSWSEYIACHKGVRPWLSTRLTSVPCVGRSLTTVASPTAQTRCTHVLQNGFLGWSLPRAIIFQMNYQSLER